MFEQLSLIVPPALLGNGVIRQRRKPHSSPISRTVKTIEMSKKLPVGTVLEFFAGIGLARKGLETAGLRVTWANDIDEKKSELYRTEFPSNDDSYIVGSIADIHGSNVPAADVAWASFPCTDLSLAGGRSGLAGKHSSTFYEFTRVLDEMAERPRVVVVENVVGLATSHGGADLTAVIMELNRLGYSVDILTIDARRFIPQSRPRLFLIGSSAIPANTTLPGGELRPSFLDQFFEDPDLQTHCAATQSPPAEMDGGFSAIAERLDKRDERWWEDDRAARFISSLSDVQAARLEKLRVGRKVIYRTAYRRTRSGIPMWEIRSDDIAGCLRTARGGSSKQAVVEVGRGSVRVRWMTTREYARLMGAGEYRFGNATVNQILFGFGDAVCVPVVAWLTQQTVVPLLTQHSQPVENTPVQIGLFSDETTQVVAAVA